MSISTASAQVATLSRYRYVAVGSETSVSGADASGNILAYTVGMEQVYLNGVLLVRTSDYTASTGTSITALVALVASDIVEILTFSPFVVANALVPTGATNGQVPIADSTQSSGYRWGDDHTLIDVMQAI